MTTKPHIYWAPGTALVKLENRHNNAACILTDTQAELNDVALIRLTDCETARAADKARIAELEQALSGVKDRFALYLHGGSNYRADAEDAERIIDAALSQPKEPDA